MTRSVRLFIAALLLSGLLEAGPIIGGRFSFTAGSMLGELTPSFFISRES